MASPTPTVVKVTRCFGGRLVRFKHESKYLNCTMHFHVFEPAGASSSALAPTLLFLSGLTCTDENFPIKSGSQRYATEHGIAVVSPDTSPRGTELDAVADKSVTGNAWDFGVGAGFYVDATQEPWSKHFRMYSYITEELPAALAACAAAGLVHIDCSRMSISGHSMGGCGALQIAIKAARAGKPFKSVSAFAPISHPCEPGCSWGMKAFTGYLGAREQHEGDWSQYDPTHLIRSYPSTAPALSVLIDQGGADEFLAQGQLRGEEFVHAGAGKGNVQIQYRIQEGYDHGYYFVGTFIGEHIAWHAQALKA